MKLNSKQKLLLAVVFVVTCCLSGCATRSGAHRFYSGPPLPKNEIALVYAVAGCHIMDVFDANKNELRYLHPFKAESASTMLDLLPGDYVIGTTYRAKSTYQQTSGDKVRLTLNAQAGNVYVIYPQIDAPDSARSAQDKQKGQKVWRAMVANINDYSATECEKYSDYASCLGKDGIGKRAAAYLEAERPFMSLHPLSESPELTLVTEEARRNIKGFWW